MAKGGAGKGARRRHLVPRSSRASGPVSSAAGKTARRNMAKQARQQKQAQVLSTRRATTGDEAPPRVLVIVAAGEGADTAEIARQITSHGAEGEMMDAGTSSATVTAHRQRFTVVRPTRRVEAVLDAMKSGDVMLLAIPADGGLDERGEQIVDAVCMQGVGTVVGVLTGVEDLPEKQQAAARKEWAASLYARFPDQSKFFCLDQDPKCAALLRHLAGITPKKLIWREQRSYLLVHSYAYAAGGQQSEAGEAVGTLTVEGYVRGQGLCAERLLHVPGVGDFAVQAAAVLEDPHSMHRSGGKAKGASSSMDVSMDVSEDALGFGAARVLQPRGVMDCVYEAEGDALAGEQTWPTAAELAAAGKAKKPSKRDADADYQKGWTGALDEEEEPDEDEDEDDEMGGAPIVEDEEDDDYGMGADALAEEDEAAARRAYLQQRAARDDDARFPDEVDTPIETPANSRFARYRGLASLKSSPWHPRENLPPEYAQVYHFEHWPTLQRQGLKEQADDEPREATAPVGAYVRLTLAAVPARFAETYGAAGGLSDDTAGGSVATDSPLTLSSLNTHENRLAVLHFTFSLTGAAAAAELVIRGKAPLVFHAGFRRYAARPIFSEDNRRSTKHKLERFAQPGRQVRYIVSLLSYIISFPILPIDCLSLYL